jgi:hypothetical protein
MIIQEQENERITETLSQAVLGERLPFEIADGRTGEIIIPPGRGITKTLLRRTAEASRAGLRLRYRGLQLGVWAFHGF